MLRRVGGFFGLSQSKSSKWKDMAERKVQDGEFGLHLKKSKSKWRNEECKIMADASKVLLHIDKDQKMEEEDETFSASQGSANDTESPSSITAKNLSKNTSHESYNPLYQDEEIVDEDSDADQLDKCIGDLTRKISLDTLETVKSLSKAKHKQTETIRDNVVNLLRKNKSEGEMDKTKMDSASKSDLNISFSTQLDGIHKSGENESQLKSAVNLSDDKAEREMNNTKNDFAANLEKDFWKVTKDQLVYGQDAFKHYKFYVEIEKKVQQQRLQCQLGYKMSQYDWKLEAINELITAAKDYYTNPNGEGATRWHDLKKKVGRSSSHQIGRTEVRRKLALIPEYRPFFTYILVVAQLVSFSVICALGGITYIGIKPRLSLEEHVPTFSGMETVSRWTPPNIWIGPDQNFFIAVGAVYAPCMREDYTIHLIYSLSNYSTTLEFGCCEITNKNVAGTSTQTECDKLTNGVGVWRAGVTCYQRQGDEMGVKHVMKPCCLGLRGQCQLLSHKHCLFLGGTFYQSGPEHCSQVSCLKNLCSLGAVSVSNDQPWLLTSSSQWWRLPLSLLYHNGIIQLVLISLLQLVLMSQIERSAGWLRVAIIYILSGTMALLTSAVFSPYQAHVGGVGAMFGMLGVITIELIQFWGIIHSPLKELLKIIAAFAVFAFFGTLPYLDLFGMLTGFVMGILCAVIVLPYITFGRSQLTVRVVLLVISVPSLAGLIAVLMYVFTDVQNLDHCEMCRKINCVEYTDGMCNTSLWE